MDFLRRFLQGLWRWVPIGLFLVVVLSVASFSTLLATPVGRVWLAQWAIQAASNSGNYQIAVEGIASPALGRWTVEELVINKDGQKWLRGRHLALGWKPRRLLDRSLVITRLKADSLELYAVDSAKKPDAPAPTATELPLELLSVQGVELSSFSYYQRATNGFESAFPPSSLSGGVQWRVADSSLKAALRGRSLADIPFSFGFEVVGNPMRSLSLNGHIDEASGGYLGAKLKLPAGQAIESRWLVETKRLPEQYQLFIRESSFPLASRAVSVRGQLSLALDFGKGQIDELTMTIDESEHQLTGQWEPGTVRLAVSAQAFPLDILTLWQSPLNQGEADAELALRIDSEGFWGEGQLDVRGQYAGRALNTSFNGSSNLQLVTAEHFSLRWGSAEISARGALDLVANATKLEVSVPHLDLNSLQPLGIVVPTVVSALVVSGRGRITGNFRDPNGELSMLASGPLGEAPLKLSLQLSKRGQVIKVQHLNADLDQGAASAQGWVNLRDRSGDLTLVLNQLSLQSLRAFGVSLPDDLEASANGQLTVGGDVKAPVVSADVQLVGEYQSIPSQISLRGEFRNGGLSLHKLELDAFGDRVLNVSGELSQQRNDLRLSVESFPTGLAELLGLRTPNGDFSAELQLTGTPYAPQFNGSLHLAHLMDMGAEVPARQINWNLRIETTEDTLKLVSSVDSGVGSPVAVEAQLPISPYVAYVERRLQGGVFEPLPLEIAVQGEVDTSNLAMLVDTESHRIAGTVTLNTHIKGTAEKPLLEGQIHLRNAEYHNVEVGIWLVNIQCLLTVEQALVQLGACNAVDRFDGRYQLTGRMLLPLQDGNGDIDVQLELENASLVNRPELASAVSGSLSLKGDFNALLARGDIAVSSLNASVDSDMSSGIPTIEVEREKAGQSDEASESKLHLPAVTLDLTIRADQQAVLRGRGLEAELQGDIRVLGALERLHYTGQLQTLRGTFEVFGKKFQLQQGQVNFSNESIGIAITGVYVKRGQQITAELSGQGDNLALRLSSIPHMPEDEILAFIIFGKSVQDVSAVEAVQLAIALQKLSGSGGGFIDPIGSTREMLGVDTLLIKSDVAESGESGLNVAMGKYLNERVYLEVERTPEPTKPWRGNLEIQLFERVTLESSAGGKTGVEGVKLNWKTDY